MGFRSFPGLGIEGVPPGNVLALPFEENAPKGTAIFHAAFAADGS